MRLQLKLILILFLLLSGFQAGAITTEYVSAFKPVKIKSAKELKKGLQKDIFQIRSIMNLSEKKVVVAEEKDIKVKRVPAGI